MKDTPALSGAVRVHAFMIPAETRKAEPFKGFFRQINTVALLDSVHVSVQTQYYFSPKGASWVRVAYRNGPLGLKYEESMSYQRFVHIFRSVFTAAQWEIITKPVLHWVPA